jgi:hypothetical protein
MLLTPIGPQNIARMQGSRLPARVAFSQPCVGARTVPGRVYHLGRDQGDAVTITSSGKGSSSATDNARVRELLRAAGLSLRAAARELQIDELAMRGY